MKKSAKGKPENYFDTLAIEVKVPNSLQEFNLGHRASVIYHHHQEIGNPITMSDAEILANTEEGVRLLKSLGVI